MRVFILNSSDILVSCLRVSNHGVSSSGLHLWSRPWTLELVQPLVHCSASASFQSQNMIRASELHLKKKKNQLNITDYLTYPQVKNNNNLWSMSFLCCKKTNKICVLPLLWNNSKFKYLLQVDLKLLPVQVRNWWSLLIIKQQERKLVS